MTISSTTNRASFTGNGVTTSFSFPYYVIAAADLKVYQAGTLKTLTTHYTLSGSAPYTGGTNVQFVTAPASLEEVVVLRDPDITQVVEVVENDPLPAKAAVERPFDKLTMIAQRLKDRIGRTLRQPDTDVADMVELPAKATRASKYLGFDADGNPGAYDPALGAIGDAANVNFTPLGVSAVSMTLQAISRETENLSRWGFGTTKTAAQNVTAWEKALSEGAIGKLHINPGDYQIGDLEPIDDCITIQGSGAHGQTNGSIGTKGVRTTNLIHTGTGFAVDVVGSGTEGKGSIHIFDLMLTGNASALGGIRLGSGVNLGNCSIQRTCARGFTKNGAAGYRFGNVLNSLISQNLSIANHFGMLTGGTGYAPTTLTFQQNRNYSCQAHGHVIRGLVGSQIIGDIGESNYGYALFLEEQTEINNLDITLYTEDNARGYTITGAVDNGAGLVRLTVPAHPFVTGDKAYVASVVGTTEANSNTTGWTVTSIDSSHVDLQASTFTSAYVSGGVIGYGNAFVGSDRLGAADGAFDIRFMGGIISDDISKPLCDGVRCINLERGFSFVFDKVGLPTVAPGFMRITSNVTDGRLVFRGWGSSVPESSITGNHATGFITGAPIRTYVNAALGAAAEVVLPFQNGVYLIRNLTDSKTALVSLNGAGNSTTIMADPDSGYSITPSTANRINVYYDSGAYRIQNSYGAARSIRAEAFMAGHV